MVQQGLAGSLLYQLSYCIAADRVRTGDTCSPTGICAKLKIATRIKWISPQLPGAPGVEPIAVARFTNVIHSAFAKTFHKAIAPVRSTSLVPIASWQKPQSAIASITPTQCALFNCCVAKASTILKTSSENPPIFKISSRSVACVVP